MDGPTRPGIPIVSAVLTTYNRKELLRRALFSVYRQSKVPEEVIVVDDGFKDGTHDELSLDYPQVKWINQNNMGVSAARNAGIRNARGKWIALLDSDDEWLPDKISAQLEYAKNKNDALAIHTGEKWIRKGNEVIPPLYLNKSDDKLFERSLHHCLICPSSVLLRREAFSQVGLFDESLAVCEDYDFWLRLLLVTRPVLIDQQLVRKHGGHPDQLSTKSWGMDRYRVQSLEKLLKNKWLTEEFKCKTIKVLIQKCNILVNGFAKRDKFDEAKKYSEKIEKYLSLSNQTGEVLP